MEMDKSETNRLSQPGSAKLASHYHKCLSANIHKRVNVTAWFLIERHIPVSLSLQLAPLTLLCNGRYVLTSAKEKARQNQRGIARGANIIKTLLFAEPPSVRNAQVTAHKIFSPCSFFSWPVWILRTSVNWLCLQTENDPAAV